MSQLPPAQGLYDPLNEHDSCGVGFVADVKGRKSHAIVRQGLRILENLEHRGAVGADPLAGDGAGILIQTPDAFLRAVTADLGITLPAFGDYAAGMVFLPKDTDRRRTFEELLEGLVAEEGQVLLGWRDVPVDPSGLGETVKPTEPAVRQIFVGRGEGTPDQDTFERKLYIIRKRAANGVRARQTPGIEDFYVPSLSSRTIVYKGMLLAAQVGAYYLDLQDERMDSALALVHQRFSTNTFPSWRLAHPFRMVCHNGEINTLRGNVNWMAARRHSMKSKLFGDDLDKLWPLIPEGQSDTASFDNALELLVQGGYSLAHAMMLLIPEAWAGNKLMDEERRSFYEYHAALMEPWDGPAAVAFTDGRQIGATLDRNGLRPARWLLTDDDLVVMASEIGVLDIPPEKIVKQWRLQPGKMFLIDLEEKRIVDDAELKQQLARAHPYKEWLGKTQFKLEELPAANAGGDAARAATNLARSDVPLLDLQQSFGYTQEDIKFFLQPMAIAGDDPVGSMGADTPISVLSDQSKTLYSYFKQNFAQVTNPPIDCIREEIVTATETTIGSEKNLLVAQPESCHLIELKAPILTNEEMAKLRHIDQPGYSSVTLPILYPAGSGAEGLAAAMESLFAAADKAIADDINILILSDRGMDHGRAAIPSLLAVAGLHHHLIRTGARTRIGLVLESGEPREVHHFALLIGYGVGAVNPYLAFETLDDMIHEGMLVDIDHETACKNYVKAAVKGVVKVISKMGISTIQSYRGAQIFEAVGLDRSLVDQYFTWTPSRIGGADLATVAREAATRHRQAFPERPVETHTLEVGGEYQWRADGELHLFSPQTVHKLQRAVREGNYKVFKEYSTLVNEQLEKHYTLRGLLDFKPGKPIPIEEVEPAEQILQRFKSGAMSYGSISKEAHEALAIAMNRVGGKSNTGEGGEDVDRYTPDPNGDSRNSAIKQVASGRFGVTSHYLVNARELQIKMAQGAKPGEGGQLPGAKVYPWIAKTRHSTPGVGLISPPPHHDIYSIEDLAELIHDLKNANHHARISVKLVSEVGVGTIAAGVAKAHADVVLISGFDGGTGASPQTSIKHAGLPWELGLAETHQTLVLNDLRSRIAVETDGQLKTGRDVVIAALLGAEEFGFATAPLVSLGCIMMRVCHLNTCPVGVATQDPQLRARFTGDPAHVVNFMRFIAEEMRELMAELGFRSVAEMVGRVDRLEARRAVEHWKAKGLDFSDILYQPKAGPEIGRYCQIAQDHGLDKALDNTTLLELCKPALESGEPVRATVPIRNINRVVGTILGSEVTRRHGAEGLPHDTIHIHFQGSAGQSFGAFMPKGMTWELEGDTNDYLGKGLSGGRIIIYPPAGSPFVPEENIIAGNVALYGATSGEVFIRGMAGERFAVRNSGVTAVVEAVGDHGCEYMTGGTVVILGAAGRNFAAGMSGGVAYVLDEAGTFASRCNPQMVLLETFANDAEVERVRSLIQRHGELTGSQRAAEILERWADYARHFVKVIPKDYKRVLQALEKAQLQGLSGDDAINAAFEENAGDLARVGGG